MDASSTSETARGRDSRDRLLRAAEMEFGNRGYAAGRLDSIADLAGLRRPSLFYHFANKEKLYDATLARVVSDVGSLVARSGTTGDALERTGRIVSEWLNYAVERPQAATLLLRHLIDNPTANVPLTVQAGVDLMTDIAANLEANPRNPEDGWMTAFQIALVVSSITFVSVAARDNVKAFSTIDTLAPENIERMRMVLMFAANYLLETSRDRINDDQVEQA